MNKRNKKYDTDDKNNSIKFNQIFKWNRIMLRIIGIWPSDSKTISKFEYFGSNALILILGIVVATEWVDLINIWGQLDPMIDNLSPNFAQSLALFKTFVIRWNIKKVENCLNEARYDWQVENSEDNIQVMLRRAKIGRIFSITGPIFAIASSTFYSIIPLVIVKPENSSEIFAPLPLRSALFYQLDSTPLYLFTYLIQSISCYTCPIAYAGIDCFFTALALHVCAQIEILGTIIRRSDARNPVIRYLVERHLRLVEFVKVLENIFGIIILVQLLVSSLAICIIGYKFITSLDDGNILDIATFLFYLTATMIQIFFYCYAGQCLIDENIRLSEATYECLWYEMSKSNAEAFLLIQSRAQIPLQITALKFCIMSHDCFADILRTSATYLSVLQAIK